MIRSGGGDAVRPAIESRPLLVDVAFGSPIEAGINLVVFALLAVVVSGGGAAAYRWYFRDTIPEGVTALLGLAVVALYLNTATLGALIGGAELRLYRPEEVFFNVVALVVAATATPIGRRLGDSFGTNLFVLTGATQLEGEVSRVVRTVGRVTAVTLPAADEIEDVDGYEPVPREKKATMAEKTLLFPRRVTVEELRERVVARVTEDYGVGYVDVDLTVDGEVEYFAVGSRPAGLGPTLAPGTVAVAVRADPANGATPGDTVQVWTDGDAPDLVGTAELRATAADVTTLAMDQSDAAKLDDATTYRLITLPAEPQASREFATLLRNADETMTAVTVADGSELVGTRVGNVSAVVAAVRRPEDAVQAIPPREYAFASGDTVYLIGRPDALRRFESAAAAPVSEASEPADGAGDGDEEGDSATGNTGSRTQSS